MKHLKLLLFSFALLFSGVSSFASQSIASGISTVQSTSTHSKVVKKGIIAKFTEAAERQITKLVSHLPIKNKDTSKFAVALILAWFLGWAGVHRAYLGGRPILILFYLLLNIVFGLGFLLGFIDFVVMLIDGNTSRFDGNDKLFAAFGK